MQITWADMQWLLPRHITTGEWWLWSYDVSCRAVRGDAQWVAEAVQWCAHILDVSVGDLSNILAEVGVDKIMTLGLEIIKACSVPDGLKNGLRIMYDVTYEADGYDPSNTVGGPCECPECRGDVDVSELCKFRHPDIGDDAKHLSLVRPDLVAEYWDKPLALYTVEATRQGAINRAKLAVEQTEEAKRKRKLIRDQILASHGVH